MSGDAATFDLPNGFLLSRFLPQLDLESLEYVCSVATFDLNLYVGTSKGNILHYLLFDDADDYMLILKIPVNLGETSKVKKILALPDALLCLALANRVIHAFSLPELSPCHIGKVKDVTEMSELTQVDSPKVKNKHDKIIAYTASKIRVVQFLADRIKLLKDINYSGAIIGHSSAAGTLANYSNICLVANSKNYDVVDLQQTRRISLFDFNVDAVQNIKPHIVPFTAKDKSKLEEEYLLTISSDASTSMAMFVNAFGEVTRGTITWLQNGYPTNGIAVAWPFVIAIFSTPEDDKLKLIFSSLESFEVVYNQELHLADFDVAQLKELCLSELRSELRVVNKELLNLLCRVDASGNPVESRKLYSCSRSIFFAGNKLFFLHQIEPVLKAYYGLTERLNKAKTLDELDYLFEEFERVSNYKDFTEKVSMLLMLACGKISLLKELISGLRGVENSFDPRLFLLLYDGFSYGSWDDFHLERGILDLLGDLKNFGPQEEFKTWLIDEVYLNKKAFKDTIWLSFRILKYKTSANETEALKLINAEKDEWGAEKYNNESIEQHFKDAKMDYALLELYKIEQKNGMKYRGEKIINLILKLLKREDLLEKLKETGQAELDFIKLAFFQLRDNVTDADVYTIKLLELLKIRPDEGLSLLKENKGGRHKATHHYILKELSKTHSLNSSFTALKIEYIELTFMESIKVKEKIDYELLEELLRELLRFLSANVSALEGELANLEILISAFRIDSNNGDWPKLSLIDFLRVHGRRSECKEVVMIYLKIYELLVAKKLHTSEEISLQEISHPAFAYLVKAFSAGRNIDLILYMLQEENDYCVAEALCVSPGMPFPKQTVYFETIRGKFDARISIDRDEVKSSLNRVLEYYLQTQDTDFRFTAISHVVETFGDEYFTMAEVLEMLPQDVPLRCVKQYFARRIVDTENKKVFASTLKMMTKQDAKFTREVAREFERTYSDLLDKQ